MTGEQIDRAAIRIRGVVFSVPRPGRHHHIIAEIDAAGIEVRGETQGFLTTAGRFVDRHEAWDIAVREGQLLPGAPHKAGMLFSEDVW